MQKGPKEGLLKILKGHRDLQKPTPKMSRDNLKDFRSNSEPPRGPPESFEDASEGEVKSKALSEDFNEDQLEAEWVQLRPKEMQQRLFQHIIHNYAQKKNLYFKSSFSFKSVVHSLQDFNL